MNTFRIISMLMLSISLTAGCGKSGEPDNENPPPSEKANLTNNNGSPDSNIEDVVKAAADKAAADKAAADKVVFDLKFTRMHGLENVFVTDLFVDEDTIYVAGDLGVRWSSDGGQSWTIKGRDDGLADGLGDCVFASGPNIYVGHKGIPGTIEGGVSISHDGGKTWAISKIDSGLDSLVIRDIAAAGSLVYAATDNGLSISEDGGLTWKTSPFTRGRKVKGLSVNADQVYVLTDIGVSFSTDRGFSWRSFVRPIEENFGNSYSIAAIGSEVYVGTSFGIASSIDSRKTWANSYISLGFGVGESIPSGVSSSTEYIPSVFFDGTRVYAATEFGVSISNDRGRTWVNKQENKNFDFRLVNSVFVHGKHVYLGTDNAVLEATF